MVLTVAVAWPTLVAGQGPRAAPRLSVATPMPSRVSGSSLYSAAPPTSSAIAASSAADSSQPWIGWPIIAGLGLGTAGWFVGALLALEIEKDCGFLGAATGTTGLALGVHLGNGRRGNFALDLLTASGVWATGFVLFVASDNQDLAIPLAVLVPIGQLAATTAVERAKGRAKERQRVGVFMAPQRDGRIALGASVSF